MQMQQQLWFWLLERRFQNGKVRGVLRVEPAVARPKYNGQGLPPYMPVLNEDRLSNTARNLP